MLIGHGRTRSASISASYLTRLHRQAPSTFIYFPHCCHADSNNRTLVDDAVARAKHALRWTYETERSTTALALVAGGSGLAILPLSLVRSLADDRVKWRPFANPQITRPVGILSQGEGSNEVQSLKEAIRESVRLSDCDS